jgi:hypothetical protein
MLNRFRAKIQLKIHASHPALCQYARSRFTAWHVGVLDIIGLVAK